MMPSIGARFVNGVSNAAASIPGYNALYSHQELPPDQTFGNVPTPVGNADRSIIGQLWNPDAIAAEDWARQQQADMLAFERNAGLTREQNALDRDLTRELAQNSYQWAVQDMKKSGINPVMALGAAGGANPVSQTSSYGTPGTGAGGQGTSSAGSALLDFIGKIASGMISGDNKLDALEFATILSGQQSEQADERRHRFRMDEIRYSDDVKRRTTGGGDWRKPWNQ